MQSLFLTEQIKENRFDFKVLKITEFPHQRSFNQNQVTDFCTVYILDVLPTKILGSNYHGIGNQNLKLSSSSG